MKTEDELRVFRENARVFWEGFCRCPTTGRILERIPGDDKVLCGCGVSNPACPTERTEWTRTHVVRFLDAATVDEYVAQEMARRGWIREEKP